MTFPLKTNRIRSNIRGANLRFLQKISKDTELLEPLILTCRTCLEHRHSYVRKNAVFALYSIYGEFEHIPDAAELMFAFLAAESDSSCKRNVFLAHCSMPKAVKYIINIDDTTDEVIRLDCKNDSSHRVSSLFRDSIMLQLNCSKARYMRCIFELLNAPSHAVKYEAATTLTTLTQNPGLSPLRILLRHLLRPT